MGKSKRKYPIIRQEHENYRYLNRKIRHDKLAELPNGGAFRKHSPHWNNWHYRWTQEDAIKDWYRFSWIQKRFLTLEEWLNYWESCAIRK